MKSGPASWAIEQPDEAAERQRALEIGLGNELVTIAAWVGDRAAECDRASLALLSEHLIAVLQTAQKIILDIEKTVD